MWTECLPNAPSVFHGMNPLWYSFHPLLWWKWRPSWLSIERSDQIFVPNCVAFSMIFDTHTTWGKVNNEGNICPAAMTPWDKSSWYPCMKDGPWFCVYLFMALRGKKTPSTYPQLSDSHAEPHTIYTMVCAQLASMHQSTNTIKLIHRKGSCHQSMLAK